ncbi:hypothetical protein BRC82_03045 [Halobacteriales archaeon QS_1_67_19]|nr:MAG: hypothetical protein BRC82_03045 [Halobacteriales archaeon QS_1_67_19]
MSGQTETDASGASGDGGPAEDTMRGRAGASRAKLWVLMEASRWVVSGVLLAGVFVALVAIGVYDPSPLQQAVASSDPVETLFQAYVTAIITGVTLVVTLNQLVLSQELGPVGDQRGRMEGAMEFREEVEDAIDVPAAPPEPAAFLRGLVEQIRAAADDLAVAVESGHDPELTRRVEEYADGLTENAQQVSGELDGAEFGTFDMLSAVLNFNYSWKIYEGRRIRNEHADALSAAADDAFGELETVLQHFGPAREHFKTLYFQWELVNLSRAMLYSALPALIVASSMIVYYDAQALPGATLGISNDILAASFGTTLALVPFVLLLSYVLRIATVAKRTLSIGPFVLRSATRREEYDWE